MTLKPREIKHWSPINPSTVERSFRREFLVGARYACRIGTNEAIDLLIDIADPPLNGPDPGRGAEWDNTSSAWMRGISQGVKYVMDWVHEGGRLEDLKYWLVVVYEWAHEFPLSRLVTVAMPPKAVRLKINDFARCWLQLRTEHRSVNR